VQESVDEGVRVTLRRESVLGFPVAVASQEECLDEVARMVSALSRSVVLACANPHSLVVARKEPAFRSALLAADILVPDGVGIVLASRLVQGQIRERVTGTDIFLGFNRRVESGNLPRRAFFLGSTAETLDAIKVKMAHEFPGVELAGTYPPPFRESFTPEDDEAMIEAVNRAGSEVLWVGMTAPKQEKLIGRIRDRLDVRFIGAIGAVFDFFTGRVERSHPAWQKAGLEWLPRLLRRPRRLWRRTFVSAPHFLWLVLRERIHRQKKVRPGP
jgi:N-acetylglucosaminyldiphosphoundecaprenol N-acetyl-beta-D-mannosaminyltransferase